MTTIPASLALYFPHEILKTDEDLARRFASPDAAFKDVFASAEESCDKLLIALSAASVARRKEGLKGWREKQVARLLEIHSKDLREYGKSLESSQWGEIQSGECALIDIELGMARFLEEANRERNRAYAESKNALKSVLQRAVHDPAEGAASFELPQSLYVSECGEVLLFRRAKNAKQYGLAQKKFHVIVHIAQGTARFKRGSET
jgi:hypothetical protein